MSAAVYYQQDNLAVEDYSKYNSASAGPHKTASTPQLSSLSRIMPLNQDLPQLQLQAAPPLHHALQLSGLELGYAPNYYSGYALAPTDMVLQQTPAALYYSSVTTTPALGTSSYSSTNYVTSAMLDHNGQQAYHRDTPDKCTCKSNPNRIPRPRNAFILFRQKYHQSVLDESPEAKTNPDVSRELGRRWRQLPPEERNHWVTLAEEEKKNHARKYPNYRYTPRRHGKNRKCPVCQAKSQQMTAAHQVHYLGGDQQSLMMLGLNIQSLQKLPLSQQQLLPHQVQQYQLQQQSMQQQHQQHQSLLQLQLRLALLLGSVYPAQQMGQFMYLPYQQMGQFVFSDSPQALLQQTTQQPQQPQQLQGAPAPLAQQSQTHSERLGYDSNYQGLQYYEQQGQGLRYRSLPTLSTANNNYTGSGFEVYVPTSQH